MNVNQERPPRHWKLPNWRGIGKRIPIIRQSEQAECGLACLAMILGHHGNHVSLRDLRERAGLSSRGASLNDLMGIAGELGLRCRPLRLELAELEKLKAPCILHWRLDHFVVLREVSRKHAIIHDPAAGRRCLPLSEVSRFFSGIAMEAAPGDQFASAAKEPGIRLRTMFRLLNGYASSLWSILGFSLALEVLALLMPQLVQIVVDQVLANGDYDLLTLVGMSFALLTLISSAISACRSWSGENNMRDLTDHECGAIAGGRLPIQDLLNHSIAIGAGAGGTIGIIVSNTAAGASRGGAIGAAAGFAFGTGWAIGTKISDYIIDPLLERVPTRAQHFHGR